MTAIKRKLFLKRPATAAPAPKATPLSSEEVGALHIQRLPALQKAVIHDALLSGYNNAAIAEMFSEQGWLTVSERTFIQYMTWYKRIFAHELQRTQEDTTGPRAPSYSNLDGIVSKLQPKLDEEKMLEQVARVQSVRLRLGVQFEQNTGIVNVHLHKDVNSLNETLKTLATMRGKLSGAGRPNANSQAPVTQDAAQALRKAELGEQAQDAMSASLTKLVDLMKEKDATLKAQAQN